MSQADFSSLHNEIATYYSSKIREFGATAKGVDWRDEESHRLRHRQFLYLMRDDMDADICDLGCGFGDFLSFLRPHGFMGTYTGYDISADMIAKASEIHQQDARCSWRLGGFPQEIHDYVVASGIFNVRRNIETALWERYISETLDKMAAASRKGFAFNILTRHSDPERQRPDLYYADPMTLFEYCIQKFGRRVAILQDTELFEFTLITRFEHLNSF